MIVEAIPVPEAAKLKGVSQSAIRFAISEGNLDGVKVEGRVFVLEYSLNTYTPRSYPRKP